MTSMGAKQTHSFGYTGVTRLIERSVGHKSEQHVSAASQVPEDLRESRSHLQALTYSPTVYCFCIIQKILQKIIL